MRMNLCPPCANCGLSLVGPFPFFVANISLSSTKGDDINRNGLSMYEIIYACTGNDAYYTCKTNICCIYICFFYLILLSILRIPVPEKILYVHRCFWVMFARFTDFLQSVIIINNQSLILAVLYNPILALNDCL